MQTCTRYLGGKKFESLIGGHRIVTDQPMSEGGTGAGVTPPELMLATLGGCAGYYALEYLQARSLPTEGLHVYVSADKEERPSRLTSFRIEVDVPDLDERQRQGVWRAVKTCLIHNTLTTLPPIEVVVTGDTQELTRRECTSVTALPHR